MDKFSDASSWPEPESGWSREIRVLDRALVLPPTISSTVQPAGVLTNDGEYCAHSATWRGKRAITTEPEAPQTDIEKLSGRWLFAGLLWIHFGHFLAESTSRLWALDQLKGKVDGILFIPKRPAVGDAISQMHYSFMETLGCDLPIEVASQPTEVEKLYVPGQGFGLGSMVLGTPEYREFINNNFGKNIEPDGPEKLYISRSALGPKRGGIIGEEALEQNMVANGYEVFHPQQHTMHDQVAKYKAAKKVVALDGSALHLFALVGKKSQKVAMIPRRTSSVHNNISNQIEAFCGTPPLVADVIVNDWVPERFNRPNRMSIGELDIDMLAKMLKEHGFVDNADDWQSLPWRQRKRAIRQLEKSLNTNFKPIERKRSE